MHAPRIEFLHHIPSAPRTDVKCCYFCRDLAVLSFAGAVRICAYLSATKSSLRILLWGQRAHIIHPQNLKRSSSASLLNGPTRAVSISQESPTSARWGVKLLLPIGEREPSLLKEYKDLGVSLIVSLQSFSLFNLLSLESCEPFFPFWPSFRRLLPLSR
jgi:hypothetical protein